MKISNVLLAPITSAEVTQLLNTPWKVIAAMCPEVDVSEFNPDETMLETVKKEGDSPMPVVMVILVLIAIFFFEQQHASATQLPATNNDQPDRNSSDPVWRVCFAIADAEGYGKAGDAPTNLNNPGDLSPGDEHGQATAGNAELHDGSYIIHFATPMDGWNALYTKIANARDGHSRVYGPNMTWQQFATEYAGDATDWVNNVTRELGVQPSSRFGDFFGV